MKKIELKSKLRLNKMKIANLDNSREVNGGGFLTVGIKCFRSRLEICGSKSLH